MNRYTVISCVVAAALVALSCGTGGDTSRGEVFDTLPDHPDTGANWILFLHGAIAEGEDRRPVHARFGTYELDAIVKAFARSGFAVLAEQRAVGVEVSDAADVVVKRVRSLLDAGVPADRITLVGFSRGGVIAILAADRLHLSDLAVVAVAACGTWLEGVPEIAPEGRLLSIRERTDDIGGPCEPLFSRLPDGATTAEVVVALGAGHGAFYAPHPDWIGPATAWAARRPVD